MATQLLEARIGTTIAGKWTLKRLLGSGGMAAVYEAEHSIGRHDAIKILHPDVAADADLVGRFEREAHAVNRFEHPAAVEIRDVDKTEDGEPYLVMELIDGESLSKRFKREGRLPLELVLRIADELLDVLKVAHEAGVIHRDIKPSNLFLEEKDGRLRVLDFGVARVTKDGPGKVKTQAGTLLGTVTYMPPEQLRGDEVDATADIYAVGATLYRLLSGRKTHDGGSEDELARSILAKPATPLAQAMEDVPEHVALVIDKALARLPEDRYADAASMQADVKALRADEEPAFATGAAGGGGGTLVMDDDEQAEAEASSDDAPDEDDDKTRVDSKRAAAKKGLTVPGDAPPDDDAPDEEGDDDEATTVKRDPPKEAPAAGATEVGPTEVDEEGQTQEKSPKAKKTGAKKAAKKTGAKKAAAAPVPAKAESDEEGATAMWPIIGGIVLVIAAGAYFMTRSPKEELDPPMDLGKTGAPADTGDAPVVPETTTPPEPPTGEGGAATDTPPPPPGSPPPKPGSKPPPKPGTKPKTPTIPGLPSGFPTAIPTTLPSSLPPLPTGFLPPPPPPAPKPAPPPPPPEPK